MFVIWVRYAAEPRQWATAASVALVTIRCVSVDSSTSISACMPVCKSENLIYVITIEIMLCTFDECVIIRRSIINYFFFYHRLMILINLISYSTFVVNYVNNYRH